MPHRTSRAAFARALAFAAVVLPALSSTLCASEAIAWRTDYERSVAEARSRNLPLWLQFTGPWCPWCRRMDRDVFTQSEVAESARADFIAVKIHSDQRTDLMERFGVTGLPATIIVRHDGAVLSRVEGYVPVGQFVAFLEQAKPDPIVPRPTRPQPEIALAGYSPVSLVEGRGLSEGRSTVSVTYDGHVYRFTSVKERDQFLSDPEKYLPAAGGACPVALLDKGRHVAGKPGHGVYYRGRLYLCADEAARARFAAEPEKYAAAGIADDGNCPHCKALAGRQVRGLPQYSTTLSGRLYLFPDQEHLEAFRASPDAFLRR